jgi:putative membrane protein
MLIALLTAVAHAHGGAAPIRGQYDWSNLPQAMPGVWIVWTLHPSICIGVAMFLWTYVLFAGSLRIRWNLSPVGPTQAEWTKFLVALAIVFFSLQGPLHELADYYLFSAHMIQHLLVTLLFPPLLIRGIPPWMWKPLVEKPWVAAFGRALTKPAPALGFATFTLYIWHVPSMYEWALRVHNIHIVEHLVFMTGAVVMWWPVHSRIDEVPALTPGYRMAYMFALTIPMKALGAIITVGDYILYPFYAVQPRVFGLDPLADQRLGGLIMWLPGGLVFWFTIGYVFFTTFYADMAKERRGGHIALPPSPVPG